jgi:hypothetical protein
MRRRSFSVRQAVETTGDAAGPAAYGEWLAWQSPVRPYHPTASLVVAVSKPGSVAFSAAVS